MLSTLPFILYTTHSCADMIQLWLSAPPVGSVREGAYEEGDVVMLRILGCKRDLQREAIGVKFSGRRNDRHIKDHSLEQRDKTTSYSFYRNTLWSQTRSDKSQLEASNGAGRGPNTSRPRS